MHNPNPKTTAEGDINTTPTHTHSPLPPFSPLPHSLSRNSRTSSSSTQIVLGLTTNISEMTKMNNKLERALVRLGTAGDNAEFRDRLHDDQNEFNSLVKDLLSSIHNAQPELDSTQFKRLSLQFDAQYKKYQRLTQQLDHKQKALLSAHLNNDSPPEYDDGYEGETKGRVQQQVDDVVFEEWHHEEVVRRVEEIKQIEGEVAEVAELYKDLHQLVNEQQEGLDEISGNVEEVRVKVEDAEVELEGAAVSQKKARTKKCCVVVMVIVVLAVAAVVVVILKR